MTKPDQNQSVQDKQRERLGKIIHTPAEASAVGARYLQFIDENRDRLVPVLLPGMDGYFGPVLPGEIVMVQAQSHNGKTSFMDAWAHRLVKYLDERGREEIVIWVDTETPMDHIALAQMAERAGETLPHVVYQGGYDPKAMLAAAREISQGKIFSIASTLGQDDIDEITLTNIVNSLKLLTNGGFDGTKHQIAAIFIDYLQALPFDPAVKRHKNLDDQRRIQVSNDVNMCRRMGSMFNAPVIMGVQAKQELKGRLKSKASKFDIADGIETVLEIPGFFDGQETSNIGQRADRVISLSMPKLQFDRGTKWKYRDHVWTVSDSLMVVQVHKQRLKGLASGDVFIYEMDYDAVSGDNMALLWSSID